MGKRATREEQLKRYQAIIAFVEQHHPVTVRQVYYNLTSTGLVPKTDAGYQKVVRACNDLRFSGDLPFRYFADSTRRRRKPVSYDDIDEALYYCARGYRKDLWKTQNKRIEIWLEKDALSNIFYQITSKWDVPLMVSRGYSSNTFLYESAQPHADAQEDFPSYIFVFTDYDAAGENIQDKIEDGLKYHAPKAHIIAERVALTKEQVLAWDLQTRDPKAIDIKEGFEFCCELDSIPPDQLRALINDTIEAQVDRREYERLKETERLEKECFDEVYGEMAKLVYEEMDT